MTNETLINGVKMIEAESQQEVKFMDENVNIEGTLISCGDERELAGYDETYLHSFGGVATTVGYNSTVINEVLSPGSSASTDFVKVATYMTPILIDKGFRVAVHSDQKTEGEGSTAINTEVRDGVVGCAYLLKRQAISGNIFNKREQIKETAIRLFPDLLTESEDVKSLDDVIDAHGRIMENGNFFPVDSGRTVAVESADLGAETVVVKGDHVGNKAQINLRPNTALKSKEALEAGEATYSDDMWVSLAAFDAIKDVFPYDKKLVFIALLIDRLGTLDALGIKPENIEVNRPQ